MVLFLIFEKRGCVDLHKRQWGSNAFTDEWAQGCVPRQISRVFLSNPTCYHRDRQKRKLYHMAPEMALVQW